MSRRVDLLSELFSGLRILHRAPPSPRVSTIQSRSASAASKKRRHVDHYVVALARARKAANVKLQEKLRDERAASAGDPIHGRPTPFVESFSTSKPLPDDKSTSPKRNHFVTEEEFQSSIQHSNLLTTPLSATTPGVADPSERDAATADHAAAHANAREAMSRITAMEAASSKDRTRINMQRCIETFGRHHTDTFLQPKLPSTSPRPEGFVHLDKTPRAGPDTGSSEVQIAILTAKIKTLAEALKLRGKKDHHNKRNLRLLVHRRQKLLSYFERKERGSERWRHLIDTLGLTEASWKGEIIV